MFEKFDGTGRPIRPAQEHILNWLKPLTAKVYAINAPTGTGKSAILRTLQLENNAVGLVPTNQLLDQYIETYPTINYIKGVDHYLCHENEGLTCTEAKEFRLNPCSENCSYQIHRGRALEGESTIYNPISYHYFKNKGYEPETLVIDEAHKLIDMLMMVTSTSFRKGFYKYPKIENELQLLEWLKQTKSKLSEVRKTHVSNNETKEAKAIHRQMEKIGNIVRSIEYEAQNYVFYTQVEAFRKGKDEYLYVMPVKPPKWLLESMLKCKTLVLMSATLLPHDVWDLGIQNFEYLDVPSPIPSDNRQVIYMPSKVPFNYNTDPRHVAAWINQALEKYPDRNTIVHLSYGWVNKLKGFFPGAIVHNSEGKNEALAKFKANGGLWLAAGCAEGIDLPDDECRLNLIPIVIMGNPKDPVTEKQLALPRGRLKYELKTVTTLIQQVGRSTRSVTDHSISIVGDSKFPGLITKNSQYIPKSFLDSIKWRAP